MHVFICAHVPSSPPYSKRQKRHVPAHLGICAAPPFDKGGKRASRAGGFWSNYLDTLQVVKQSSLRALSTLSR